MDTMNYTRDEYIRWIYDKSNEYRCEECPHRNDTHTGYGQQNCWVTVHIESANS